MKLHARCNNCGVVTATANLDEKESEWGGWPFTIQPCCGPSSNPCISIHKGAAPADACYANHVTAPLWTVGMSLAHVSIEMQVMERKDDPYLRDYRPPLENVTLWDINQVVLSMLPANVYSWFGFHDKEKSDGQKFINMIDALNDSTRTPAGTQWVGGIGGGRWNIMLIPDEHYGLKDVGPSAESPVRLALRWGLQDEEATEEEALDYLNKWTDRAYNTQWGFKEESGFGLYLYRDGKLECV
tara:strand:- start:5432 stop:6157 length:726 start_codon:yes stop_codon:yes gene_type:complete